MLHIFNMGWGDLISIRENVHRLGAKLAKYDCEPTFERCKSMEVFVYTSARLLLVTESADEL